MTVPGSLTPDILKALGEQIRQCETARRNAWSETFSSGYPQLDRRLPDGGFARGTLVEWLAAAGLGVDLKQLIVVRPANQADEAWAIDQALRCAGVAAVVCWPGKLDDRTFRRWQLAAEEGGTLGMLLRPLADRQQPSWAELRLLVAASSSIAPSRAAAGRILQIEVLPCRGAKTSACSEASVVELDIGAHPIPTSPQARHEPHSLPLVASLAFAAAVADPAGTGPAADRAL